jgi:hypothetical protein
MKDFENRFCDLKKNGIVVEYVSFAFKSDLNIKETADIMSENYLLNKLSLENEILTLIHGIFLKTRAGQESFWKLAPRRKFPNLRRCREIVHSSFGSIYLGESAFSYLRITKSKRRSSMTDEHLQDSQYSPDFHQTVDEMQAETSHQRTN